MGFPRPRLRGELGWGSADTLVLLDWDDTCFPTLWYAEEEKKHGRDPFDGVKCASRGHGARSPLLGCVAKIVFEIRVG